MTVSDTRTASISAGFGLNFQWGPIIAGAIAAAALAFVLDSFGLAIGLAFSSAAPTWRDTSFALALLSGLYLVLVALAAYGLGGYIAGRMRAPAHAAERRPWYVPTERLSAATVDQRRHVGRIRYARRRDAPGTGVFA